MFAFEVMEPAVWNSSDPNIGLVCSIFVLLTESDPVCMLRLLLKLSSLLPILLTVLLVALNLVRNFSNSAADRPFAIACVFTFTIQAQTLFTYADKKADVKEFMLAYEKVYPAGTVTNKEKSIREYLGLYINSKLKIPN